MIYLLLIFIAVSLHTFLPYHIDFFPGELISTRSRRGQTKRSQHESPPEHTKAAVQIYTAINHVDECLFIAEPPPLTVIDVTIGSFYLKSVLGNHTFDHVLLTSSHIRPVSNMYKGLTLN